MDVTNDEHSKDVLRFLNELRERSELTDVVLEVEGRSFPCHRAVLASCSPYFRGMFTSGYAEVKQEKISIQDLDFVCTKTAEYMKGHLDESNCVDVLMYADMLGDHILLESSGRYIASRFNQVALQPSFLQLSLSLLQSLVDRDDLITRSEDDVVQAAIRWIEFDQEKRLQHLPVLCRSFRRSFISSETRAELYSKCQSTDCKLVYSNITSGRLGQMRIEMQLILREDFFNTYFHQFAPCYDPSRGRSYTISLPGNLDGFSMVATADDELYLAGRSCTRDGMMMDFQNVLFQYNHLLNSWESRCAMITPRIRCGLVYLKGYIYAIGGDSENETAERYDPSCDVWTPIPRIPHPMPSEFCAVTLEDRIYVICWKGCYSFSATENKWSKAADMLEPPLRPQAVTYRGCIYCMNWGGPSSTCVEMYNPKNGVWKRSGNGMSFAFDVAILMPNMGSLYLLTVLSKDDPKVDLYQYKEETDSWMKPESPDIIVAPIIPWLEARLRIDCLVARMIPKCLGDPNGHVDIDGHSGDGEESDNTFADSSRGLVSDNSTSNSMNVLLNQGNSEVDHVND
ncbi:kelch repeat and BTB domain-containing protein 8-like isoform X2 [Branchiostoma lanceolatum]|uniref:kelch repeat and BTB domain-containing protein 8-like isoform X2 n=1 Tax=Branchiostoma lanceolatum TaxID=7740 RepID=UPI00345429E9